MVTLVDLCFFPCCCCCCYSFTLESDQQQQAQSYLEQVLVIFFHLFLALLLSSICSFSCCMHGRRWKAAETFSRFTQQTTTTTGMILWRYILIASLRFYNTNRPVADVFVIFFSPQLHGCFGHWGMSCRLWSELADGPYTTTYYLMIVVKFAFFGLTFRFSSDNI